jgi:hypothetical protein
LYLVSFTPISVSLVYLVPPARSRYCASPEASIMRLKAALKMGATASAPTQHFHPTKWLRNFAGTPIFHPTKWLRNFAGAPISGTFSLLRLS